MGVIIYFYYVRNQAEVKHLIKLAAKHIIPTSFDCASWLKAAAYGNVFFPKGQQLHITAMRTWETTLRGLKELKKKSKHTFY